jgi:hypothetical protein
MDWGTLEKKEEPAKNDNFFTGSEVESHQVLEI